MATLEELVVSLVAETQGLRSELDKATKATQSASGKMDKAIEGFSQNSSKQLSFFESSMASAAGFLASQAVIGAFNALKNAASALFTTFVTEGVQAAILQENAVNRMNTALALTGKYSKDAAKEMQDFASSMQQVTKYGDDAVLETGALIQSLGALETQGLKRATAASIDMAAALGIDLKAAATLVGKAATGEISSFTRYGVIIEKGANAAETFERALTSLEKKFGGTAANQVKTYSGLHTQLTNTFGDLTEEIGNTIIKNQALLEVMAAINKKLIGVEGDLKGNQQAYKTLVGEGIVVLIDTLGVTLIILDNLTRAFQFAIGVVQALAAPFTLVSAAAIAMTDGFDAAKNYMDSFLMSTGENLSAFGDAGDNTFTGMAQNVADLGVAAQSGLEQVKAGLDSTVEPMNVVSEKIKELSEGEAKRQELLKGFATGLADNAAALESSYALEQELQKLNFEEKLINEEEYLTQRLELLNELQMQEQAQLDEAKSKGLLTETQYKNAVQGLENKQFLDRKKMAVEFAKFEEKQNQLRLQGTSQFFQGLSTLASSSNKQLASIGKAAAIGKATIDTYTAANLALATIPPPFGAIAAAGAIATGLANVAKISGVALNKGGTVPGGGPNSDSVPAMLTPGEEVINRDTAEKLRAFLDSGGGNSVIELRLADGLIDFIEARLIERASTGVGLLATAVK